MSLFIIDVEADGNVPGIHSMICFGAVKFDENLDKTFYGKVKPISDKYDVEILKISGFTREEHETFEHPKIVMKNFAEWIDKVNTKGRPIFLSDNLAFDWQWINYYFHVFYGNNPFGWSGRRIADLYCGLVKDMRAKWKYLRKTPHTHNPVDDAKGNAEVLLFMIKELGLKL